MENNLLVTLTLISAVGCGVVAGVFFAFSTFIMKALGRLPAAQGVAAMQAINEAAPAPLFMAALFGTALGCAALVVTSLFAWGERWAIALLAGGILYLCGVIVATIGYHIPRNNALAGVNPHDVDAASHWDRYRSDWTAWNHGRTTAALAAAISLTLALRV